MKPEKAMIKLVEKVGSMTELSKILNCSLSYVSRWASGERKIPIKYIKKLVQLSEGEITREDLRPDVFN